MAVLDAARSDPGPRSPAATSGRTDVPKPEGERLTGPEVPAPGALPGTLTLTAGSDCRLHTLDLASVVLSEPGAPTGCRFWLSPGGDRAVLAAPLDGRRADRELTLVSLPGQSQGIVLGAALGEVAWSRDGERLAWCGPDGSVSIRVDGSADPVRPAGCRPRFAPDGTVITRPDEPVAISLLGDGRPLLARAQLEEPLAALGSRLIDIAGFGVGPDGTVAVAVLGQAAGALPLTLLELWRDGALRDAIRIPTFSSPAGPGLFGLRVELSPDGNEAAILFPDALAFPGPGTLVALVDLRTRAVVLSEAVVNDVAWSPDSAWLAVAAGSEITVYGTDRSRSVYRLPVASRSLAWRDGR